jgi:archaellin
MRKTIFAILAAAAMVACSNDELVNADREAIAFDNAFVDNATRSVVDPSFTNTNLFADFKVYGYVNGAELFDDGARVAKYITNAELSSDWRYESTQYWIEGGVYDFQAVAPLTNGDWTATANTNEGMTLEFTNDGETDLLYAKTNPHTATASGNPAVEFNFKHILSKVRFSFANAYNAHNTKIRVHSITVNNAVASANVALSATATTWDAVAAATGMTLNFGAATDNEASAEKENVDDTFAYGVTRESQNELLLIPANYPAENKLKVTFMYDVVVGGVTINTFTVNPEVAVNLVPGHAYDFKATIEPGQPIEFTVTSVDGWTEENKTM